MARPAAAVFLMPLIERAWSRASFPPEDGLIDDCEERKACLWVVARNNAPIGVVITRVVLDEGRRAIKVVAAAGYAVAPWMQMVRERLHEFRRAEGAEYLLCVGRKGWGRMLRCAPDRVNANGTYVFKDFGHARR
jgi:hypothetical protein